MNASATPEETIQLFAQCVRARDLDGLVALYEPNAVFVPAPGAQVRGHDALRASFREQLFALRPELELVPAEVHRAGDLAFISNNWTLSGIAPDGSPVRQSGRSSIVLRRQAGGDWRIAIDRL